MMEVNFGEIAQIVQAGAAVAALGISLLVVIQIRQTKRSIEHSSNVAMYTMSSEFYKFLAENHELRPYFYDNKFVTEQDINKDKIYAACEYLADFFEFVHIEKNKLKKELKDSWESYMKNIYENSPAFRDYISDNEGSYTKEFIEKLKAIK